MKQTVCTTLLAACGLSVFAQEAPRPNIVVFLVDDMGLMDTSLPFLTDGTGNPQRFPLNEWYRTPNMERLAHQGVRFSNFYAQSVSSPTRTSIMTGQNSARHRITNWINSETNNRTPYGPTDWKWDGLGCNDVTLPRVMQAAGYRTIHVGKAHFGHIGSEGENPKNVGFDINIAGSSIGQPGSYYGENGYGHIKGNKSRAVDGLEKYHGTNTFLTDALTIEANREMEEAVAQRKPFFLHLAHYALHTPFETDSRFINNYPADAGKSEQARIYASLVEGMDKSLGEILDKLEALGVADNTLIIFLGDNGSDAPLGPEKGYTSSAPLRGKKGTEYEGGVRAPFIAAWAKPNGNSPLQKQYAIKPNSTTLQIGTVMDLFPTIAKIAGAKNPKGHIIDGQELWTIFAGNQAAERAVLMHFPHEHRGSYFTTYHVGDWKLIYRYNPENPSTPGYELYNLKNDPYEKTDLAQTERKQLIKLTKAMATQLKAEGALYPVDKDSRPLHPIVPAK